MNIIGLKPSKSSENKGGGGGGGVRCVMLSVATEKKAGASTRYEAGRRAKSHMYIFVYNAPFEFWSEQRD